MIGRSCSLQLALCAPSALALLREPRARAEVSDHLSPATTFPVSGSVFGLAPTLARWLVPAPGRGLVCWACWGCPLPARRRPQRPQRAAPASARGMPRLPNYWAALPFRFGAILRLRRRDGRCLGRDCWRAAAPAARRLTYSQLSVAPGAPPPRRTEGSALSLLIRRPLHRTAQCLGAWSTRPAAPRTAAHQRAQNEPGLRRCGQGTAANKRGPGQTWNPHTAFHSMHTKKQTNRQTSHRQPGPMELLTASNGRRGAVWRSAASSRPATCCG